MKCADRICKNCIYWYSHQSHSQNGVTFAPCTAISGTDVESDLWSDGIDKKGDAWEPPAYVQDKTAELITQSTFGCREFYAMPSTKGE